jgi:hypothetical protein
MVISGDGWDYTLCNATGVLERTEINVTKTVLFETTILFLDAVSITELPGNVNTSAFALALGACGCEWKVRDWQANSASQSIPTMTATSIALSLEIRIWCRR